MTAIRIGRRDAKDAATYLLEVPHTSIDVGRHYCQRTRLWVDAYPGVLVMAQTVLVRMIGNGAAREGAADGAMPVVCGKPKLIATVPFRQGYLDVRDNLPAAGAPFHDGDLAQYMAGRDWADRMRHAGLAIPNWNEPSRPPQVLTKFDPASVDLSKKPADAPPFGFRMTPGFRAGYEAAREAKPFNPGKYQFILSQLDYETGRQWCVLMRAAGIVPPIWYKGENAPVPVRNFNPEAVPA